MAIAWNQNLSVNDESIDSQHKQLIAKVNELLEATSKGRGKELLIPIVDFLGKYAQEHFSHEEEYMSQHNYVGLIDHRKIHQEFIKKFLEFRGKVQKQGVTASLTIEVQHFLGDWLINHIAKEDHKYAEFVKNQ